jgi:predicted transcriptional regulator of viral defense system
MALYDSGQTTFTNADAVRIAGLQPPLASSLLHKAAKRGVVSRLRRGLFVIVPPELGTSVEYSGNPALQNESHFRPGIRDHFLHTQAILQRRLLWSGIRV